MFTYTTGSGVDGFTLDPSVGLFLLSYNKMKIPKKGNIYSVNESNCKGWDTRVKNYVDKLKDSGYTQRLIGTMVADVHRTLLKGGMFCYPSDNKSKRGKLRLLYEVLPMAFLVEQAGGRAIDGEKDIIYAKPNSLHERTPIFLGSKNEIVPEITNEPNYAKA
ncbi:Fructose-1,6-bisphosphatase [Candidatus Magnetoovum chiemensis]|nr:Fructose-1,6-bisphosphatase [Candidatus Magnetoovum chiemensis]